MENIALNLTNPDSQRVARDLLRIDQEEWGKHVGVVSKEDAANYIMASLFGTSMPVVDCGLDNDMSMSCLIYAYPAYIGLFYTLAASNGTLSGRTIDFLDESEGIIFTGSSKATLKNPVHAVKSSSWYGEVYDLDGGRANKPEVIFDGDQITLGEAVSGVLVVNYTVVRHTYTLTIFPAADVTKNKYSSVVYGRYKDGIAWTEISPPPNADNLDAETPCGWGAGGGSTTIGGDDSDDDSDGDGYEPPECPKKDRKIKIDYCTQELISDSAK